MVKKSYKINTIRKKFKPIKDGCIWAYNNDISIRFLVQLSGISSLILFLFAPDLITKSIVIALCGVSIMMELINTSIETTIDRISYKYNILSKHAKDTSACASFTYMVAFSVAIIMLYLYTISYYNEWKRENPNNTMWDYIKFTFDPKVPVIDKEKLYKINQHINSN